MVRRLLISYVSPGEEDWSCKVCVVSKLDAQDYKTTPSNKYRPIILQDEAVSNSIAFNFLMLCIIWLL